MNYIQEYDKTLKARALTLKKDVSVSEVFRVNEIGKEIKRSDDSKKNRIIKNQREICIKEMNKNVNGN